MADGRIEIETTLETKEFEKDVGKLNKALNFVSTSFGKVKDKINKIGEGFSSYIKGSSEVKKETEDMSKSFDDARAKVKELEREIRSTSRRFGKNSQETINAKKSLYDYVLALDDATFKQVFMKDKLGLTESKLVTQAGAIKVNAKMIKMMGSETELLIQRMEGLQQHGIKPEDMLPKSTIGQFQLLNETMDAGGKGISKLSLGYRTLGNSVEGVIKKYSAQKVAIREAKGDMAKYGVILRGITMAQGNLAMAIPIVGVVAGLAYKKMFDAALASDEKLKELSETVKSKVSKAFEPLIKVAGDFLEVILNMVDKVSDLIIKFNEAHPTLARILGIIGFITPAMTLLLLPLSMGVGLWKGWALMINMAWTAIGGMAAAIGVATSTFLTLAAIITGVILVFKHLWKTNEDFRTFVISTWENISSRSKEIWGNITKSVTGAVERMVNAFKTGGLSGLATEVGKIFTEIGNYIVQAIPNITTGITNLINTIILIWSQNAPMMWQMGLTLLTHILTGIAQALPQIITTITTVLNSILNVILQNLPMLIQSGVKLLNAIVQGITQAIPTLINSIVPVFNSIIGIIVANLPLLIDAGIQMLNAIIDGINQILPQLIDMGLKLIQELLNAIVQNLPIILDAGVKILTSLIEGITQSIPKIIEGMIPVVKKIIEVVIQNLPKIIEAGIEILIALIEGITKSIPKLIDAIIKLIPVITNAIITNLPKILDAGVKILIAIVNGIAQALPKLIETAMQLVPKVVKAIIQNLPQILSTGVKLIGELIKGIGQAIPELLSSCLDIGVQIVKGIWNGITSMGSWFANKAKNFFSNLVKDAKESLDIHSPSRVFRDLIGKNIVRGIGVGIEIQSVNLEKDFKNNLRHFTNKMRAAVDFETSKVSSSITIDSNYKSNIQRPQYVETHNDNGITQHNHFYDKVKSPSETIRALKRLDRGIAYGI